MQLLGQYRSSLASFHYQELLSLLKQAVQAGEYSANKTFDQAAVIALQKAAQDFSELSQPSSGQRVTDDTFNRPLQLLSARFAALASESKAFSARASALISVLEKDSALVDQLLASAALLNWAQSQPQLNGSKSLSWDFAMGYGTVNNSSIDGVVATDPVSSVLYTASPALGSVFNTSSGNYRAGLLPPLTTGTSQIKSISWSYATSGLSDPLYGDDWASLSILEDSPRVNFSSSPGVEVLQPIGASVDALLSFSGQVTGGSLPLYIRIQLAQRRRQQTVTPVNAAPTLATKFPVSPGGQVYIQTFFHSTAGTNGNLQASLSFFNSAGTQVVDGLGNNLSVALPAQPPSLVSTVMAGVVSIPVNYPAISSAQLVITPIGTTVGSWVTDSFRVHIPQALNSLQVFPDSVSIYAGTKVYFATTDFSVDSSGSILFRDVPDASALTVLFTEKFPAYQCSVNNTDWSPVVMLDPVRPYPDDTTTFLPTNITNGRFPLTDELGTPVGLYMKVLQTPATDYLIRVTTPASGAQPGPIATLTVEFGTSSYMTGISVSPFTDQPLRLLILETQGFTADTRHNVYAGSQILDRQTTFTFPRQLVGKLFLTVAQENYSLKEYTQDPPDKLRRDTLSSLQAGLPFASRRVQPAPLLFHRGAQYDFGLEHIAGVDWSFQIPGVYVSGPYRLSSCPEVIRFDASFIGSPQFYLCFRAYNSGGVQQDVQLQGLALTSGNSLVFPFASSLNRALVDHVDIFLKIAFRSASDIVERFAFQVDSR
jgi:hypothetical protein